MKKQSGREQVAAEVELTRLGGHAGRREWLSLRERFRAREGAKFVLLLLPALFWAGIFLGLAGVAPLERIIESTPDAAQVLIALGCPLLAVVLGVGAAMRARDEARQRGGVVACWATVVTGVALFVFAALVSLRVS